MHEGDEIRVIAPSQSWSKKYQRDYERAKKRLESLGYKVTFGESIKDIVHFGTASREERVKDFNDATETNLLGVEDGKRELLARIFATSRIRPPQKEGATYRFINT